MGFVTQDTVAYIIEVRNLYVIKEDHVLQFHGIAYHTVFAHQSAAADIGTMPDFRTGTDDAGSAQEGGGGNGYGFVDPHCGGNFCVVFTQVRAKRQNQIFDAL